MNDEYEKKMNEKEEDERFISKWKPYPSIFRYNIQGSYRQKWKKQK